MPEKKMTIEDLAEVIQRTMASKEDLKQLATKKELGEVREELGQVRTGLREVVGEMGNMREDIHYIRTTMTMLVQNDTAQDAEIGKLDIRVGKLEQKKIGVGA